MTMLELIKQSNTTERYLFAGNVAAALINVALPLAFPDGWVALNWFVAGLVTAMAANLIFVIRWRLLLERQDNALMAATKMVNMLISPEHYEAQLTLIIDKAKRDGVLPWDVELHKPDQPKLH